MALGTFVWSEYQHPASRRMTWRILALEFMSYSTNNGWIKWFAWKKVLLFIYEIPIDEFCLKFRLWTLGQLLQQILCKYANCMNANSFFEVNN